MNNTNWIKISQCPICSNNHKSIPIGYLPREYYRFGLKTINIENGPVNLFECKGCGLVYKDLLPSNHFLKNIFTNCSDIIWNEKFNLYKEISLIDAFIPKKNFDILDIGPSNGEFLKQFHSKGRKSGIDIVVYPELLDAITGEFIDGFIDDDIICWSGEKYDLITAFDIFEHFYNPRKAFNNFRKFLKSGGYLVIETGDIKSKWPTKYGPHNWWYVALFEHHIFWSFESIKNIAQKEGFSLVYKLRKRNKNRLRCKWRSIVNDMVLTFLFQTSPRLFSLVSNITKPSILQPWSPIVKDHIFVILQRN